MKKEATITQSRTIPPANSEATLEAGPGAVLQAGLDAPTETVSEARQREQSAAALHLERKIRLGAILVLFGILVMVAITQRCLSNFVQSARWVEHTNLVLTQLGELNNDLTKSVVAKRLYLLSHNAVYLEDYKSFSASINTRIDGLTALTTDNPPQQLRLQRVRAMFESGSSELTHRGPNPYLLSDAVNSGQTQVFASPITRLTGEIRAEEEHLLVARQAEQNRSTRHTYIFLVLFSILLLALLAGIYLSGTHALIQRRKVLEESLRFSRQLEATNETLEKLRVQADEANQLKSKFLASMSHELRTPLNAISGFSELLSEEIAGPINDKQKRFVEHIRSGAKHLLHLINEILDLSKIEAGETTLELEMLDAAHTVDEVVSGIKPLTRSKSINLQVVHQARAQVHADRRRLKQILYNLLSNAVKFTPEHGTITIRQSLQESDVVFEVIDNGPGISKEDQAIIFEEFRQASAPSGAVREGTGLGLAITKKLIEKHRGQISVSSCLGEGSCFTFTLPLPVARASVNHNDSAIASSLTPGAPLILVVDDDANARELLCSYLQSSGYRTAVAESSADALNLLRELKPDLITLDVLMPGGNGFSALYELKQTYKEALPPVVIISVIDDRGTGFALGAADYLMKPVGRGELVETLQKHLPNARANVLLIDDDAAMLEMAKEVFAQTRFTLHSTSSGQEGLEIAKKGSIDAIVLDLIMPGMDGFDFLQEIRKIPRLSHLPVCVLTSKTLDREELQLLKSHTQSVFSKGPDWRTIVLAEIALRLPLGTPLRTVA